MKTLDIAIAGCGPAGMAAALLLHRQGRRVTIFERFAVARPVGSGLMLQPTGLAVLREIGLDDRVRTSGARIERLSGKAADSGNTVLDVRYAALGARAPVGAGIHRAALFAILYDALVAEGVPVETERTLVGTELCADGRRRLRFETGPSAGPFDLVVDALGARTPLAPRMGGALPYGALWTSLDWPEGGAFDPAMLEQRYRAASVMTGVLPIGRPPGAAEPQCAFFWSLRHDRLDAWRQAGLEAWKADVERLWPATRPLLDQLRSSDDLTFARYAHCSLAAPAERGMIHIGDAWRSASPQLGQGANMALLDAWALALALRREPRLEDALEHAVSLRRGHVRLYQAMSALFTPIYQSDSRVLPAVRDRLVGPVSKLWPATVIQAAMVSGLIGAPLGRLELESRPAR